ncbi:MAG: hypothetical protein AAF329_01820 [Cyanobacteria bacterium P01_A01_bin.17]
MRSRRQRLKKEGFARKAVAGLLWVSMGWFFSTEVAAALPEINRVERGSAAIRGVNGLYRSAGAGDRLELDEAVLPSARSRVVVTCPNNTRRRVTPGRLSGIGIICPDVRTAQRSRNENDLLLLNGGVFPYTVRVVEAHPVLSWPSLGGDQANLHTVAVSMYRLEQGEPNELIWHIETEGMQVDYAGPPLAVGEMYGLVVEVMTDNITDATPRGANGEQVQELCGEGDLTENSSGVGRFRQGECFRSDIQRLDVDEVAALTALGIESEILEPELQALTLAYRYAESGVYSEVVGLVEPLVAIDEQRGEPSWAVYQLLAESYLRLGRIEQAQMAYARAEGLAVRAGDYHTRLAANLGLAKVAAWRVQPERVVDYLWAALRDVGYVRDQAQADEIVQWLNKLE